MIPIPCPYPHVPATGTLWGDGTVPEVLSLLYAQTDVIVPGLVLHLLPDATGSLPSVAPTGQPAGIWMRDRDHDFAPFVGHTGQPFAMALSIITRGRVIALASGVCTSGQPARYSSDGTLSDAGTFPLPHALFCSPDTRITQSGYVVAVELHSPLAA